VTNRQSDHATEKRLGTCGIARAATAIPPIEVPDNSVLSQSLHSTSGGGSSAAMPHTWSTGRRRRTSRDLSAMRRMRSYRFRSVPDIRCTRCCCRCQAGRRTSLNNQSAACSGGQLANQQPTPNPVALWDKKVGAGS